MFRVLAKTTRSLFRNPLIIAIVAGTVIAVAGWELPDILKEFTTLLGAAQWAGDVAHNPYRSPCFTMRRYGL